MSEQELPDPLIGRVIAGKLHLEKVLGSGAMGVVYRARHAALDKIVAIKVLRADGKSDPTRARRFKAEARAASRLDHPNSVQILDFGEDGEDGLLYICMEFLSGEDLQAVLKNTRKMPPERTCKIMLQVLGALGAAHERGVIHRDMKPGNVMLLPRTDDDGAAEDLVKVCDFGLAKILDTPLDDPSGAPLTKQGSIFGTPAYMAPEQARGEPLDPRADLYACGVIMFKMLTGEAPFYGDTAWGLLMKHMNDPPPRPRDVAPELPAELEAIILKALEKDREKRFQSAREMRAAIKNFLREAAPDMPLESTGSKVAVLPRAPSETFTKGPLLSPPPPELAAAISPLSTMPPKDEASDSSWRAPTRIIERPKSRAGILIGVLALAVAAGAGAIAFLPGSDETVVSPIAEEAPVAAVTPPAAAVTPPVAPAAVPENAAPARAAEDPALSVPEVVSSPPKAETAGKKKPRPGAKSPAPARDEPPPKVEAAEPGEIAPAAPAVIEQPAEAKGPEPEGPRAPKEPPPVEARAAESKPAVAPPAVAPPAAPPKETPKKLSANFKLDGAVVRVKISGGVSTRRTEDALSRYLEAAKQCLRPAIAKKGEPVESRVDFRGTVDVRGRIRKLTVEKAPAGAEECLKNTFSGAQLPAPDTGDASLSFGLSYRADS